MTPLSNDFSGRSIRLFFALLLLIAWSGLPAWSQQATPQSQPANERERLERAFTILQQADERIPPDSYDPVAVVKNLGGRTNDLFQWVCDNTRWVPYRGALRGANGVLIDRLGNSLDRSLLLAEFYRHTPVKFRLAHATLSAGQAKALFGKLKTASKPAGVAFELRDGTGPASIAASQQLERLGENLTQRISLQSGSLTAALGTLPKSGGSSAEEAIAALTDHWWLQQADGDRWIDLDVTLPGAKPGDVVCAAAETFALEGLPKECWHTLRIAVVTERWADGKLSESTVMSKVVRPGPLAGSTIYLIHQPLDWAHNPLTGASAADVASARAQALTPTEWVPMLKVGSEVANDAGIRPDGSIDPKPQLDTLGRTGTGTVAAGQSTVAGFDSAPAPRTSAGPPGVFTAEWVEYTVHSPGIPDETIRREVFDLIGPAARATGVSNRPAPDDRARANAALALAGHIDIVALPCQLSPAFVNHVLLRSMLDCKDSLLRALEAAKLKGGADVESTIPAPCPAPLYGLALLRRLFSVTAADWYIARLNIFTYHSFARLTEDGRQAHVEATDLVTNDVAIDPWSNADATRLRLQQGVLDTAAEGAFLPAAGNQASASGTLDLASTQSLGLVVVRAPADLDRVKASPDDMARLRAAVAAGNVVVVPSAPVRIGSHDADAWWQFDPSTGRTLGIGQNGWGPSMVEDAMLKLRVWVVANREYFCLAATVVGVEKIVCVLFGFSELQNDAISMMSLTYQTLCGSLTNPS